MRRLLLALALGAAMLAGASPSQAVVGGRDVPAGSYTNVAEVTIAELFGCSGTLIAPSWVLTAGHCGSLTGASGAATPAAWPAAAITVRLGSNKPGRGTLHRVARVIPEPDYLLTTGYDVSLLELAAPVTAVPSTPVAGPGDRDLWAVGTLETIVGWGVTDPDAQTPPDTLQQAEVPIVADDSCAVSYSDQGSDDVFWSGFDPRTMVCAGYPQGGVDTCQGDSGGPMFARTATSELRVVGATSYGRGCARPGYPGIYARVADDPLRNWIASLAPGGVRD